MNKFSFTNVFTTILTFFSNCVLSMGRGITLIFSLIISLFLAILIYFLYEVPVKDIQIYTHKVWGYKGGKDYSHLRINLDYGMDLTKKYKKDFKPGIELYLYPRGGKDYSGRAAFYNDAVTYNGGKGVWFNYDCKSIIQLFSDSTHKIKPLVVKLDSAKIDTIPIFVVSYIESKLPRSYNNIETIELDSFNIGDKGNVFIEKDSTLIMGRRFSSVRMESFNHVDTITGLDSYEIKCYVANYVNGNVEPNPIYIPSSPALTKANVFSLYDISQSYFHLIIDVPTECDSSLLDFDFAGAIDLSNIEPTPDEIHMSGFRYTDSKKIAQIRNRGLWMHISFKQMANFQIIRMFIITTLFAFFVTITLTTAYSLLQHKSRRYRIKRLRRGKDNKS